MKTYRLLYVTLFLLILTILNGCRSQPETRLIVYVGSGMKNPMLEIKYRYEIRYPHVKIDYLFTGSKILEQTIRSLKQGDVLMPGDKKHIDALMQDGFIAAQFPIALHVPVILTLKDNTTINTWSDLAKAGVRLCIPNPDMASIGRVANIILQRSPLKSTIRQRITTLTMDTDESLKYLLNYQVDAVISWDSMLEVAADKLRRVEIPAEINEIEQIWIAVSTFSKVKEEAMTFAKFVGGTEGVGVFQKMGFSPIQ